MYTNKYCVLACYLHLNLLRHISEKLHFPHCIIARLSNIFNFNTCVILQHFLKKSMAKTTLFLSFVDQAFFNVN